MTRRQNPKRRPIAEVKARLAECVREAEAGVTTVLTRHGRPVACLTPLDTGDGGVDLLPAGESRERGPAHEVDFEQPFRSVQARRTELRRLLEEEIRPREPAAA